MKDEILETLYNKLPEYIVDHLKLVMDKRKYFKCPTGRHKDESPSCHIMPHKPQVWHCFGCGESSNIFGLAHLIEKLPADGEEFWTETVPHLCKVLKVDYEPVDLDQPTKDKYRRLRAYKDAAAIICNYPEDKDALIYKYLKERNWSIETAKLLGIGYIESFDTYIENMKKLGWKEDYLMTIELMNKKLISKKNLMFIVCDERNRPVGFAARDMFWKPPAKDKYINSSTSIIYQKGEILYNLKNALITTPPLWIVEGYGDCVKMWDSGIRNVAAIGSTFFTNTEQYSHVDLLERNGITDVILALDGDESGRLGIDRALDILCGTSKFNIRICRLPEGYDPDSYISEFGPEKLLKLPLMKPFEYKLSLYPHDADKNEICKDMVKFIDAEKSTIIQHNMIKVLSERTDVPYNVIEKDIRLLAGDRDWQRHQEFKEYQDKTRKEILRAKNMEELSLRLTSKTNELQQLVDLRNDESPGFQDYKKRLMDLKERCETTIDPGYTCGKFRKLEKHLDGFTKHAAMIGLAGISNIGKTSWVRAFTLELLRKNPDLIVLFMSIDDALSKIVPAYIALDTGLSILDISRSRKRIWDNETKKNQSINGWARFMALSNRLIITDIVNGGTTHTLEKHIKQCRQKFPDKKVLAIVDNFHKLRDFPEMGTESRTRYTAISSRIKDLTTIYDMPIINVLELRKSENFKQRPNLQDIKDTIDIEYDCDLIWIMHQDMHVNPGTHLKWKTKEGREMPIVELHFAKNKLSDYKGKYTLKFMTNMSKFDETTEGDLEAIGEIENPEGKVGPKGNKTTEWIETPVDKEKDLFEFKKKSEKSDGVW